MVSANDGVRDLENGGGALTTSRVSRLGRYDVVAKLGHGGMAQVFLGVRREETVRDFRKLVVLKVLHETFRDDAQFVDMFHREAAIAARLSHPNVVHTYTVGEEDGHYCIVMEYLDGASLGAHLKVMRERTTFVDRLPLVGAVSKALAGLHYVHEFADYDGTRLELVHRDIKPANVFLTFDGQVKLLDFGVAKMTATEQATSSQVVKGTVHYMAPEALDPTKTIDRRTDVFAAGLVLWEVANGRRIWGELTNFQILRSLAGGTLPALEGEGVPDELLRICRRATAFHPNDRYPTALAFQEDVDRFLATTDYRAGSTVELSHDLFAELRERRTASIRERLRLAQQFANSEPALGRPLTLSSLPFSSDSQDSPSTHSSRTTAAESVVVPRSTASAVLLAAGGAVVGIGIFAAVAAVQLRRAPADAGSTDAPAGPATEVVAPATDVVSPPVEALSPKTTPPSTPAGAVNPGLEQTDAGPRLDAVDEDGGGGPKPSQEMVEVRLLVEPSDATVRVGDVVLEHPVTLEGTSGETVDVRVSASGYKSRTIAIELDKDKAVPVRLTRARRSSDRTKSRVSRTNKASAENHDAPTESAERDEPASTASQAEAGSIQAGQEMNKPQKKPALLNIDKSNPLREP